MANDRTVQDIRAELGENKMGLKSSFAQLRESVEPKNIAKQGVEDVKQFARSEYEGVKRQFVDEDGKLRTKRVLAIAGACVGAVAFVVTLSVLSGRQELRWQERRQLEARKARKALADS
ncbi:hypothetical protein [uncultured Tessaracoccus sp.]|uniref:hypothetical protein n=1 Tax=uncultured Tessaracoccus sp. TaxID=905023 RepID=UPI0025DEB149|nr:hypothetical protein [uncultured Tessaracoccus sp.]